MVPKFGERPEKTGWTMAAVEWSGRRVRVAVVGTAVRDGPGDADELRRAFREAPKRVVKQLQAWGLPLEAVTLVSGGSAWSDHVAVQVVLRNPEVGGLQLELPAEFGDGRFDVGTGDGLRLNQLHRQYQAIMGVDALAEVALVMSDARCAVRVHRGFFARNDVVAKESDRIVALGLGPEMMSGTRYTWQAWHRVRPRDDGAAVFLDLTCRDDLL